MASSCDLTQKVEIPSDIFLVWKVWGRIWEQDTINTVAFLVEIISLAFQNSLYKSECVCVYIYIYINLYTHLWAYVYVCEWASRPEVYSNSDLIQGTKQVTQECCHISKCWQNKI